MTVFLKFNLNNARDFFKQNYIARAEELLAYLVLLFLPTQLGKHFWPAFSFIQGLRIDYLSPTIYFTDILILLLFLVWMMDWLRLSHHINRRIPRLIFPAFLLLLLSIVFAKAPLLGWYGLIKLLEFLFFGWYMGRFIFFHAGRAAIVLATGICLESFLALSQLYNQGSLGGLFYFLGERTFSTQTPGIANASVNGALLLRPYATFSHPNVLAAYLVISMTLHLFLANKQHPLLMRFLSKATLFIGSITLLLTLSRMAILVWLIVPVSYALFLFRQKLTKRLAAIFACGVTGALVSLHLFFPALIYRFFSFTMDSESIQMRLRLMQDAFSIILHNPLFGVGLLNFLPNLSLIDREAISVFSLQPVHNIFLLLLSETGVMFFLLVAVFLGKLIKDHLTRIAHRESFFVLLLLLELFFLGSVDHFFLTIQQGQLLLGLVLGFCFANEGLFADRSKPS